MSETFKELLHQIATGKKLHTALLYTLSHINKSDLAILQETWPTIDVERRRAIMEELVEITEINFEVDFDPTFIMGLGDSDAQVRAFSIKGLWENEQTALIKPLIHLLKADEAVIVREAAATALGKYIYLHELEEISSSAGMLVEEALLDTIYQAGENVDVRRRAIEAVSFSGDKRIPPIIENAYYDDNVKMQTSAVFAMGRNGSQTWLPMVLNELDNPASEIRFEACRACGELETKEAVEKLAKIIDEDADVEVQEMALWALGRIGGQTAREILEICLEHPNEILATAAEQAMDELNLFDDSLMLLDFTDYFDDDEMDELFGLESTNGASH